MDRHLFIESGRAAVYIRFEDKPPTRVRPLLAGAMVGELGFNINSPRTATIRADSACEIPRITKTDIRRLEESHPRLSLAFHRSIAKRLRRRIRGKDRLIAALARGMKRPVVRAKTRIDRPVFVIDPSRSEFLNPADAFRPPSIGHFALAMHIVNHDVAASRRHLHIVATRQRALGVAIAAAPMFAHGGGRELIVFRVAFIKACCWV
jgi:CRP-like cAMP-binding protein